MAKKELRNIGLSFILSMVIFGVVMAMSAFGILNNYKLGIAIMCCINIILASSLNLAAGYLGQLTLGHAGFMSVGAYASAILADMLGLPFIVNMIIGGLAAAVIGVLIGIPTLRLKGDYLCIITLAFNEIIRVIMLNLKITNGALGYSGIEKAATFPVVFFSMLVTVFVIYSIVKSKQGRAIISIREDETAAELTGVKTTYYKILAFTISAFFAGVAGALFAHYITFITPKLFDFNKSVEILVMVVLGGMGNWVGVVIAAIVMTILPEALRSFSEYRMLIYAIVLIIAMILQYSPQGQVVKEKLAAINPFKKKGGKA